MPKISTEYRGKGNSSIKFLDSVHLNGKTTGKNIAENVLNILKKHNINIQKCH